VRCAISFFVQRSHSGLHALRSGIGSEFRAVQSNNEIAVVQAGTVVSLPIHGHGNHQVSYYSEPIDKSPKLMLQDFPSVLGGPVSVERPFPTRIGISLRALHSKRMSSLSSGSSLSRWLEASRGAAQ